MNVRDIKEQPKTSPVNQKKIETDADDAKKNFIFTEPILPAFRVNLFLNFLKIKRRHQPKTSENINDKLEWRASKKMYGRERGVKGILNGYTSHVYELLKCCRKRAP